MPKSRGDVILPAFPFDPVIDPDGWTVPSSACSLVYIGSGKFKY